MTGGKCTMSGGADLIGSHQMTGSGRSQHADWCIRCKTFLFGSFNEPYCFLSLTECIPSPLNFIHMSPICVLSSCLSPSQTRVHGETQGNHVRTKHNVKQQSFLMTVAAYYPSRISCELELKVQCVEFSGI